MDKLFLDNFNNEKTITEANAKKIIDFIFSLYKNASCITEKNASGTSFITFFDITTKEEFLTLRF